MTNYHVVLDIICISVPIVRSISIFTKSGSGFPEPPFSSDIF